MEKLNEKKLTNIILILFGSYLFIYLQRSIGIMPLMDYWIERDMYIEQAMNGGIAWSEIIKIPHGIHANPLFVLMDNFMISFFKCDNRAYIYIGFAFMCISLVVLKKYYFRVCNKKSLWEILGGGLFLLPVINLNQWEIFTLYCNLPFMLRICFYFILLIWLEEILNKYHEETNRYIEYAAFVFLNCFTILFASQAYLWGLICAEIAICIFDYVVSRKKKQIINYLIIIFPSIVSGILFMITAVSQEDVIMDSVSGIGKLIEFVKGIFLMLSATIVPLSVIVENINLFLVVGFIIFVFALGAVYLYIKFKIYESTKLPLALLVYAFVSICSIIYARIDSFGFVSLASSRYVVETTLGLMGMVYIYWVSFREKYFNRVVLSIPILIVVAGIIYSNNVEWNMGPARKAYNDSMVEIAKTIETRTDDEIAIFQSSAENVKSGLETMKKYGLCIYEREEYEYIDQNEFVVCEKNEYLYGWYEDGWVEKNSAIKIYTGNATKLKFSYTSFEEQNLKVTINGIALESNILLQEGNAYFEIPCVPNEVIVIAFESDKEYLLDAPDTRVCSYNVTAVEYIK